ncbi:hypothetical protein E3N88_26904 [Mikania micrantha]|uniref:Replication protein A OB domain-containing protein n=1 Tax=Mikania micrantha TaxID=192012 RepID=A0A5N6MV61_9ASTR|nr:hypothetical protein E3N88_26904 [Mikania micrantha]
MAIGDGTIGKPDEKDPTNTRHIDIPERYLIPFKEDSLMTLIHFIYDSDTLLHPTPAALCGKAIICPTNEHVEDINSMIIKIVPGTSVTYTSTDNVIPLASNQDIDLKDDYEPDIEVHSCYKVTKYIVVDNKSYNPTLKHQASLKIGKKTYFEPFSDKDIPYHFFQFASYDLDERMKPPKQLTDFIGVVEKNFETTTTTGKALRKVDLRDENNKPVQLTLWPAKRHLIGGDVKRGDIIAINSAQATQFRGKRFIIPDEGPV